MPDSWRWLGVFALGATGVAFAIDFDRSQMAVSVPGLECDPREEVPLDCTPEVRGYDAHVGLTVNGSCGRYRGWTVRSLFDVTPADPVSSCAGPRCGDPRYGLPDSPTNVPRGLEQWCLYLPEPDVACENREPLRCANRAEPVVLPMGDTAKLSAYYTKLTAERADVRCIGTDPTNVRTVLFDNAPTGPASRTSDPANLRRHGHQLANIVLGAACPSCPLTFRNAMPLKLEANNKVRWDLTNGGDFGGVDWLAQAIVREVRGKRDDEHLVLNLSLGIHPEFVPAKQGFSTEALRDALTYARCMGALPIAAVGNATTGNDQLDKGALYPAAWASEDMDAATCDRFFPRGQNPHRLRVNQANGRSTMTGRLVYPVAAFTPRNLRTADDNPLSIARPGARWTSTVAFGGPATANGSVPLFGTSVASALVATAAQRLWAWRSDLSAAEVMTTLTEPKVYLPLDPHFYAIHISKLAAKESLFAQYGSSAGATLVSCKSNAPFALPNPPDLSDPPVAGLPIQPKLGEPNAPIALSTLGWIQPSPNPTPCSLCPLDFKQSPPGPVNGTVSITLDELEPAEIQNLRLLTRVPGQNVWTTFALPAPGSGATEPLRYKVTVPSTTETAKIEFQKGGTEYTATLQVNVHP